MPIKKYSTVRLGDVCRQRRGPAISAKTLEAMSSDKRTGYCYLPISGMPYGGYSAEVRNVAPVEGFDEAHFDKYRVDGTTILLTRTGLPYKVACADDLEGFGKVIVGNNVFMLQVDTTKAVPAYIKLYLESSAGRKKLSSGYVSGTTPVLSKDFLLDLQVPLPSLSEQEELCRRERELTTELRRVTTELVQYRNETFK